MTDLAAQLRNLHQPDHTRPGDPCTECAQPWPCRTFEFVDMPRRWVLLYTGSRAITDRRQVYTDLDKVLAEHPVLLIRHGACGGAAGAVRPAARASVPVRGRDRAARSSARL
jgi:hypothetical protein